MAVQVHPRVSVTETLAVTPMARVRGLEAFKSSHLWTPTGARGVFGGQVIAQSIMAACKTVEGKDLHSQHCYFLLPANSKVPITFTVERLRDGKSYATRLVHALQDSKTVFILMASFTAPPRKLPPLIPRAGMSSEEKEIREIKDKIQATPHLLSEITYTKGEKSERGVVAEQPPAAEKSESVNGGENNEANGDETSTKDNNDTPITHSLRFRFELPSSGSSAIPKPSYDVRPFAPSYQIEFPPDMTPWGKAVIEEETWTNFLTAIKDRGIHLGKKKRAVQNYIEERKQSPVEIAIARQQAGRWGTTRAIWIKARLEKDEVLDPNAMRALFGFMTDFQFIGTGARSVGLSGTSSPRLGMMASLDHTTHYYPFPADFDPSAPLLHTMESVLVDVASGRGFVRGLVYTENGHLLAATSQEGVIRANFGEGQRPTRETDRNKAKL